MTPAERTRLWREQNPEKYKLQLQSLYRRRKEYGRKISATEKESSRRRAKNWIFNNPDRYKIYQDEYYLRNKEKLKFPRHEYYLRHKEDLKLKNLSWVENNRERRKTIANAYYHRSVGKRRDRNNEIAKNYRESHRKEMRSCARQWRIENPDRERRRKTRYRLTHPDYARKAYWKNIDRNRQRGVMAAHKRNARLRAVRNDLTLEQWFGIKEFYENKCVYCEATDKPLTIDHIQPISKGGEHTASNIVPACKSCNSRKWNKLLPDPMLAQLRGESGRALLHGEPMR